jgi:hypothetical protein
VTTRGKRWAVRHNLDARREWTSQRRNSVIGSFASVLKLRFARALVLSLAMAGAGVAGCSPKGDASDSTRRGSGAAAGDSITITKDRSEDLTGDGAPEKIILSARGSRMDSLRVRLEIRGAGDSVLYVSSWTSRFYFQYLERAGMSDAAADSIVRRHLDAVLADSAFRTGVPGSSADTMRAAMMRDAIRYDIATNQLRTAHGLPLDAEIPPSAHDSINVLAASVPKARIDALYDELKGKKSFTFFAGGEVTYSIAWSDREKRFVTIFSCC